MSQKNLNELRQKMEVVIKTLYNINGMMPSAEELYTALGTEYLPVLGEYVYAPNVTAMAV